MKYRKTTFFENVQSRNISKSTFNLSHEWKAQLEPGNLVPILTLECMPGDEWEIDAEFLFRFAPLYFPLMHSMTMKTRYFWCPNRILWIKIQGVTDGWAEWITQQNEEVHPFVNANQKFFTNSYNDNILTYMGIPLIEDVALVSTTITGLNAFPLSAYLKIFDEYYRVPAIEEEKWFPLQPGDNSGEMLTATNPGGTAGIYRMLSSKWERDYFTTALPSPQIGEAIKIPMFTDSGAPYDPQRVMVAADGSEGWTAGIGGEDNAGETWLTSDAGVPVVLDVSSTAATLKQLREATVKQSFYEMLMKFTQRYRDFMKGFFGRDPEPGVVDVPVFLGSKFGQVRISDVMTQAFKEDNSVRTGDYTGQANMYEGGGKEIRYTCREHGWIIALMELNPNAGYGQGIDRKWRREVQTDYPMDMFSTIGDQEILKEELLYNPVILLNELNRGTFGYTGRFNEMRWEQNKFCGGLQFTTGKSQHLGKIIDSGYFAEALYEDYIAINEFYTYVKPGYYSGFRLTDTMRVLPGKAVSQSAAEGSIYAHIFHSINVKRQLPVYSTPKLV